MKCKDCLHAFELFTGGYGCDLDPSGDLNLCQYMADGGRPKECPKSKPKKNAVPVE